MRGALMVCGTGSDTGKSHMVTGLCRLLHRRGVRVAPFKAQNMALNSFVTPSGHEIGRAQGVQALAAGAAPEVAMNPILLKPTGERTSQVVVMGEPIGHLDAADYHAQKPKLLGTVLAACDDLRRRFDVVILEGAGSPAEINLRAGDIANMGFAEAADVPVVPVHIRCDPPALMRGQKWYQVPDGTIHYHFRLFPPRSPAEYASDPVAMARDVRSLFLA